MEEAGLPEKAIDWDALRDKSRVRAREAAPRPRQEEVALVIAVDGRVLPLVDHRNVDAIGTFVKKGKPEEGLGGRRRRRRRR